MQKDNLKNETRTDANNLLWAVLLTEKGYEAGFKDNDLSDLMDLKEHHDKEFIKWYKEHYYAGLDDQLDSDLQWLGKVIKFFIERGYLKNCP
jgi:hypothetical protein